jgi:hypothetical protein
VVVLGEIEDMVLLREFKRLGRCTAGELVVIILRSDSYKAAMLLLCLYVGYLASRLARRPPLLKLAYVGI